MCFSVLVTALYNSPSSPRSHARTLPIERSPIMDSKHLSDMIFRSGRIAPYSCSRCVERGTLCVVSVFSSSCGLCLRSALCCSFILTSVPAWMNPDVSPASIELRSDLRRAVNVVSHISAALDASASVSGPPYLQILGSYRDSRGSLLPPKFPLLEVN